ncbi:MAG: TonB-dependent receptor [Phenylobacterium sp.]|nr:MAG: TonB-dependent receptor [Phenylobacterium sp.]
MGGSTRGVVGYRKARNGHVVRALALAAGVATGVATLGGAAHAEEAATEVSGVVVKGEQLPLSHDTGLATLATTIQDTPQAISLITAEQLKALGIASLEGALRNVPGITIAIGEGGTLSGDQFKIRGFDAKDDLYLDGLHDFGAYTRDSFDYQEVQVLKGPSGAMFGRSTAGGAINVVTRTPQLQDFGSVDLYAGNGDYYRGLADLNHQIGPTAAVRLTVMANDTGVVDRDLIYSQRWGAALSGAIGLGTDTTLSANYTHQHNHQRPDYGIIIAQPPGSIVALPASEYGVGVERSSFLGFRNDVDRSDTDLLTVRFTHQASDKLSFTSDTRYAAYSRYFQYSTLDQCTAACTAALFDGNPATEAFGGIGGSSPYQMDAWGLQNVSTARLDYDLGPFKNQAILGLDLSKEVNDKHFLAYTLPPGITTRPAMPHPIVGPNPNFPAGYGVFNPVPGVNLFCPATGNCTTNVLGGAVVSNVAGTGTLQSKGDSTDAGLFLTDRLWLADAWSVIGSYRLDRYDAKLDTLLYTGLPAPEVKAPATLKSPRISLVFEPHADQTYYLSWGKSQTPQGTSIVGAGTALTLTAKDLAPEDSQIWEAGAKLPVPGTRLAATISIFDIKKDNALQTDPATGFLQAQSGEKQQVKGIELGLTGKVTQAWTVSAGYTYLDATIKQSFANCAVPTSTTGVPTNIVCPVGVTAALPILNTVAVGQQVTFVPKTSATLFTEYHLDSVLPGLKVGGDVTYQSKLFLGYTARSVSFTNRATLTAAKIAETPESVSLDAFASYRTGRYRFAVNAYNLANRLNYTQVFGTRATPAAGRTVIFSVGANF